MIKIIDNTGIRKKKEVSKVPFFVKRDGNLYLAYKTDDGEFSYINVNTGHEVEYSFGSILEMFNDIDFENSKIVKVEIIVSDYDE